MTNEEIAELLEGIAKGAEASTASLALLANPIPALLNGLSIPVLYVAASILRAGGEPIGEITRLLAVAPLLKQVDDAWAEHIRHHFPKATSSAPDTPSAPDTKPGTLVDDPEDDYPEQ